MAKDAELDRLKVAQDEAFRRKQDAYQVQQRAWERLNSAREVMNRAHEAKQRAYELQDSTWQALSRLRDSYGPRIEQLNRNQETAFQNMGRAFENASAAHSSRNGAMAATYAAEGHRYKAESQGYVAERRGLVDELRSATARHNNTKPAFQRAKEDFNAAKREFDQAREVHNRAKQAFQEAKAAFDRASKAFRDRLERVKAERNLHREKDKRLAERAGVPHQYLDAVKVRYAPDGGADFFFGGIGTPNGPGHGHYAIDRNGAVTYKRDPFDPHGSHNFTNDPRWQRFDGGFAEALTYRGMNAIKESGIDSKTGRPTINIYYGGAGGNPLGTGHGHDVFYQDDPQTVVFTRAPRR